MKLPSQARLVGPQRSQPCALAQSCWLALDFGRCIFVECWQCQLLTGVFGMPFRVLGARPGQVLRDRAEVPGLTVRQG